MVAQKLFQEGPSGSDCWNFGPERSEMETVSCVADMFCKVWGDNLTWSQDINESFHEAHNLSLDITKAKNTLGWNPKWSLQQAIDKVVEWHKALREEKDPFELTINQIKEFLKS